MVQRFALPAMVGVAIVLVFALAAPSLQAQANTPIPDDIARWLEELDSDDPAVRADAAMQLGLARAPKAAGPLLDHIGDPDPTVGYRIATALGQIAAPDSANPLTNLLRDPDPAVRWRAAKALGLMGAELCSGQRRPLGCNRGRRGVGPDWDAGRPCQADRPLA